MQKFAQDQLKWLEFDLLADIPHLKHAVFLRHGGFSQGPFQSLNVSYNVGDQEQAVQANRARIQSFFETQSRHSTKLFWGNQTHGKQIVHLRNKLIPETPTGKAVVTPECDALTTQEPNVALTISHADCQAAIFYDPHHRAIANVHAGWRGNVQNIYAETIQYMQKAFGSKPSELLVCISPSLGPDESEFIHYTNEFPEEFWQFQVRPTYFDLWAISSYQLQQAGVLPNHIEIAGISTYANKEDYFSYRRDKITGRHATCVMLVD